MQEGKNSILILEEQIWDALLEVMDPEIPVISVVDMGMINRVGADEDGNAEVDMTPTFAGCPAISYMQNEIYQKISAIDGINKVTVNIDFSIPWNSDRITEKGRKALKDFGFAPPPPAGEEFTFESLQNVECPRCGSKETALKSPFGPTLCRALHYCFNCLEAFEQFKPVK